MNSGTLDIDDLEVMLDKSMCRSFNVVAQDGSAQEVAEELMTIHEGCLQGNYASSNTRSPDSSGAAGAPSPTPDAASTVDIWVSVAEAQQSTQLLVTVHRLRRNCPGTASLRMYSRDTFYMLLWRLELRRCYPPHLLQRQHDVRGSSTTIS